MTTPDHPPVIQAAARIFEEHPEISNFQAMKRLVGIFGRGLAERLRINRFERQVRQPAFRLLRTNGPLPDFETLATNGVGTREYVTGSAAPDSGSADASAASQAAGAAEMAPEMRSTNRLAQAVDDAVVRAFALGAAAESRSDIVRAYRELDELRRAVARLLDGPDS